MPRLSGPAWAFAVKEFRTFFRDQTQWPQLFLIAALIVIYLYNFSVLPLGQSKIRTIYLQNIFSFLNMGLAAFVLTAVAARFVYPAVSFEGDAFWIVRAAPISLKTFLWVKFVVYYLPLLILAEILIVSSNILLQVTPFMMALSVVTVFLMVPGVVALGVGLGAAYPDFQSENPAQSVTSFGGLLFMLLAAGLHRNGDHSRGGAGLSGLHGGLPWTESLRLAVDMAGRFVSPRPSPLRSRRDSPHASRRTASAGVRLAKEERFPACRMMSEEASICVWINSGAHATISIVITMKTETIDDKRHEGTPRGSLHNRSGTSPARAC